MILKNILTGFYLIHEDINNLNLDDFGDLRFDICIDDGSHFVEDQIKFIELFYPLLNKGGYLIIEDIHDLENNKQCFDLLDIKYRIVDMRKNGQHDNVLIIIEK